MISYSKLVPELIVFDLQTSLLFWCQLIGFNIAYSRKEEHFAYLDLNGAQVMLEQYNPLDREWETDVLEKPLGRGINFQIEVENIQPILDRLFAVKWELFAPVEERWYKADDIEHGQRQFLVQDPDGYLLRINEYLGERNI